jgi:cell division protease FtsH
MVTKWGLSERLGPLSYSEDDGEVFLGRSVTRHKSVSDTTSRDIDEEIRKIIDTNYTRARKILTDNMDKLRIMADTLMKYETIDSGQIDAIMEGREPGPPADWHDQDQPPSGNEAVPGKKKPGKGSIGGPASLH